MNGFCICSGIPAHSATVSAVYQEYWSKGSGHSHVRRLSDQNHNGLHELQQQHTRLHKDERQHQSVTNDDLGPAGSNGPDPTAD